MEVNFHSNTYGLYGMTLSTSDGFIDLDEPVAFPKIRKLCDACPLGGNFLLQDSEGLEEIFSTTDQVIEAIIGGDESYTLTILMDKEKLGTFWLEVYDENPVVDYIANDFCEEIASRVEMEI